MSGVSGPEAWPGYFRDPIAFYMARRKRRGMRLPEWHDDPIRGMHVALAQWAGQTAPKLGDTRRQYQIWRLEGLIGLDRDLTPAEEREFDELVEAWQARRSSTNHRQEKKS